MGRTREPHQRKCYVCGKEFVATSETYLKRKIGNKMEYFCCRACKEKSYIHIGRYDKIAADKKRREYLRNYAREHAEKNKANSRRYYAENREIVLRKKKAKYEDEQKQMFRNIVGMFS